MPRLPTSAARWPGGLSHPCAQCGEVAAGIPVGGLCAACAQGVARRAALRARWVALGTTSLLALYVGVTLRSLPPVWQASGRWLAAVVVAVWYWLTYRIVKRIVLEWLR